MKVGPLKGKECACYEGLMFTKDDVISAVQWLKENINYDCPTEREYALKKLILRQIDKAFEDVINKEE